MPKFTLESQTYTIGAMLHRYLRKLPTVDTSVIEYVAEICDCDYDTAKRIINVAFSTKVTSAHTTDITLAGRKIELSNLEVQFLLSRSGTERLFREEFKLSEAEFFLLVSEVAKGKQHA